MSERERIRYDRRRFLRATGVLSLGMIAPWACAPGDQGSSGGGSGDEDSSGPGQEGGSSADPGSSDADSGRGEAPGGEQGGSGTNGLPPRVVGLRSLGGAFRFDPVGLSIAAGESVHWLNMGDFHSVSAFHPDNDDLIGPDVPLRMPEGAASYHSGMLGLTSGTQFSHRFEIEGVYDYFCQPHYSFGMVGRVIVGGPRGGPALSRPDDDLNEASRQQMPSVDAIQGPTGAGFEWASRINGVLYTFANGEDGGTFAGRVSEAVLEDDRLRDLLSAESRDGFVAALDTFTNEATGGQDYEAMVRQADEAKSILRSAAS